MVWGLYELLGECMTKWHYSKGDWPTAVARGILAMREETAQILENIEAYKWSRDHEGSVQLSSDVRDEKLVLADEARILDGMERGEDPGEVDPWDREDAPPQDEEDVEGEEGESD